MHYIYVAVKVVLASHVVGGEVDPSEVTPPHQILPAGLHQLVPHCCHLLLELLASLHRGCAVHLGAHAAARPRAVGVDKVVGRFDVDHGEGDPELLRHHLTHLGVDPLPHLDPAVAHRDTPVRVVDRDVDVVAGAKVIVPVVDWNESNPFFLPEIILLFHCKLFLCL